MRRAIFLDRDGTLIKEPVEDLQVDSLEKLEFLPGVFRNMYRLRHFTDYELVIVSNQDGLGTDAFPLKDHEKVHEKFLKAFRNEGVEFNDILIDPSLPEEDSPNRKPRTGMLGAYLDGSYDLENSYVIGDRFTDLQLAENLGARSIWFSSKKMSDDPETRKRIDKVVFISEDWDEIYGFIRAGMRRSKVIRNTSETQIEVELSLDGDGKTSISTGLGFFDHMLEQIGRHGGFDLRIQVNGDLHVDEHHTVEDTALALGEAFKNALGNKMGIERYGFVLPMDESLAKVAIDFGGRPWLVWNAEFKREKVGDLPTELFPHFFKSFTDTAACNLNIDVSGSNEHHKIEAVFKAFAKALRMAVRQNTDDNSLPSTKGVL